MTYIDATENNNEEFEESKSPLFGASKSAEGSDEAEGTEDSSNVAEDIDGADNSSQQKGYVDTEGNQKCAIEKGAQEKFLTERDAEKRKARSTYDSYISKINEYVSSHDSDCTSGTELSTSKWNTCSNDRFASETEEESEVSEAEGSVEGAGSTVINEIEGETEI